jgi:hypothetical protein
MERMRDVCITKENPYTILWEARRIKEKLESLFIACYHGEHNAIDFLVTTQGKNPYIDSEGSVLVEISTERMQELTAKRLDQILSPILDASCLNDQEDELVDIIRNIDIMLEEIEIMFKHPYYNPQLN